MKDDSVIRSDSSDRVGIVLTGTIIPNANYVAVKSSQQRRSEYLAALKFYSSFGEVWFLENSGYNFDGDSAFLELKNVHIMKYPKSNQFDKGKGYQEFEMLDSFFTSDWQVGMPERFVKVTGRYIIRNFASIFRECQNEIRCDALVDAFQDRNVANTYLLYCTRKFYLRYMVKLFLQVNDSAGRYIEHVVFAMLKDKSPKFHMFQHNPVLDAVSGSTGVTYHTSYLRHIINSLMRLWWTHGFKRAYLSHM